VAALLLLGLLAATPSSADAGRLFRYRDARGVMHIGTNLPPGQAQAGYEVLDSRSLKTLNTIPPALSAEQRRRAVAAAAAASKAEQARQKELVDQKNRDRMLLQSYADELELTRLRDSKLQSLNLILQTTENTIGHLRRNLTQMDQTLGEHAAAGRQPPAALAQARARTAGDLVSQEQAAVRTRDEQNALRARFDADLDRYRRLTGTLKTASP
jgi:flagellar biosynthesis GTPase FlhF